MKKHFAKKRVQDDLASNRRLVSYEEKLALLKILAQGNQQIESGGFRDTGDVFADLERSYYL